VKPKSYQPFYGRLMASPLYQASLGWLLASHVRRFVLLAALPAIWILLMNIGPIFQMAKISLMTHYPLREGVQSFYNLDNYRLFFNEPLYFYPLMRSFVFCLIATAAALVIIYPIAYYLAKIVKPRHRARLFLLLLLPFWAGELIRTFAVIMLLANRGAINVLLRDLGLIERPIIMLYTSFSVGFGLIYLICLYMLFPLYAALEKIPDNLLEASHDLGANGWARFRRIILPLSKDGIVSGCCLVFLTTIGVYATPVLLGGPGNVLFPETINSFFHGASDKWPIGAALSCIMLAGALSTAALFMGLVGRKPKATGKLKATA